MTRTLSHADARRVYDRIGSFQDSQAFYEDRTTGELIEHGSFERATRVFEFGCGTGRFAESLLTKRLGPAATYRGIDLSPTMVGLANRRLARFAPRAEVVLCEGGPPVLEPAAVYDRWVSNFVLDLLSDPEIDAVLEQAHRMLAPDGLLCLASLSTGRTWYAQATARLWQGIHTLSPELVGGCRPIDLISRLSANRWRIVHHRSLAPFLIPSDAIVAIRI
ncbi:MAG TPA: class I SAM-dependent methyltransferase [Candidatus Binatia bacterium]